MKFITKINSFTVPEIKGDSSIYDYSTSEGNIMIHFSCLKYRLGSLSDCVITTVNSNPSGRFRLVEVGIDENFIIFSLKEKNFNRIYTSIHFSIPKDESIYKWVCELYENEFVDVDISLD